MAGIEAATFAEYADKLFEMGALKERPDAVIWPDLIMPIMERVPTWGNAAHGLFYAVINGKRTLVATPFGANHNIQYEAA